jgi:SAM-dependent methyltransferase
LKDGVRTDGVIALENTYKSAISEKIVWNNTLVSQKGGACMMYRFKTFIRSLYTELLLRTRLGNYCLPRWRYNFTVPQLIFLCECVDKTRDLSGPIVEIGCAIGSTTVFLNKFMDAENIEKDYVCVDTFAGFVDKDIQFEASRRGKKADDYEQSLFRLNKKEWFDETMKLNEISRVRSIRADISEFDFSSTKTISLCLLDVDLYLPTMKALPEIYERLHPDGMIVVDDCDPECKKWDGAWQAYGEFMDKLNRPRNVMLNKLGIITKS